MSRPRIPDPATLDSFALLPDPPAGAEPMRRAEMVMIRRAFLGGWGVSEAKRQELIERLRAVLDDPRRSARDKAKAVETLAVISRAVSGKPR